MVASGGAIVGLYPRRVGEVKWSKKKESIGRNMSKKGVGRKRALCLHHVIQLGIKTLINPLMDTYEHMHEHAYT